MDEKPFRIGIVRLGKGEVSYYDPLSKVHLTLHHPTADIYNYMNTARLKRAVRNRTIQLVAGTLATPSLITSYIAIPEEKEPKRVGINFGNLPKETIDMPQKTTEGVVEKDVEKTIPAEEKKETKTVSETESTIDTKKKKEEV